MNIGIDARWIFREISGISLYTRELLRHLAIIDQSNNYIIFFNDKQQQNHIWQETKLCNAENFSSCILPWSLFSIQNQLLLPHILHKKHIDVFHSTNYMIPLRAFPVNGPGNIRCVTTVHDLIPLMFPEYTPRSKKHRVFYLYRWLMQQIGKRSDLIIADSQTARKDILLHLHIKPEKHNKVVSIPIGVSDQFKPLPENTRNLAGTNAMRKKRILWVGRPDPYKNLLGLVEAFARLLKDIKFPLELRLVGSRDMRYPEAGLRMRALGIENCVNQIGYVSDNELVEEYQNADVFILPSFYEGFGLPVVEAMACGTPVICSTNGALPEVVGNAALKVQPFDITGMAEALKRILTNETLAKDMRIKGLKRALKFRWQETARKTLEAYKLATL